MTINDLKLEIIRRGITEVSALYDDTDPKRIGALEGFEIARWLDTPEDFAMALNERRAVETEVRAVVYETGTEDLSDYWRARWCTLQIEFVAQRMAVLWGAPTVSARALAQVVDILNDQPPEII